MRFLSPPMIRGRYTVMPSWSGRGGTHIPAFGMEARTPRSELASESVSTKVMDGAGIIGDPIGITEP
jgi:hypothetical protein